MALFSGALHHLNINPELLLASLIDKQRGGDGEALTHVVSLLSEQTHD